MNRWSKVVASVSVEETQNNSIMIFEPFEHSQFATLSRLFRSSSSAYQEHYLATDSDGALRGLMFAMFIYLMLAMGIAGIWLLWHLVS